MAFFTSICRERQGLHNMKKRTVKMIAVVALAGLITTAGNHISWADNMDISTKKLNIIAPEDMLIANVDTFLNIRLKPDSNSVVIAKLEPGDSVEMVEEQGDWIKVNVDGQEGYVYSKYVMTGEKMGDYVAEHLDLYKKTVSQEKASYQVVYKTKEAAKKNEASYKIKGIINNKANAYINKTTDSTIDGEYEKVEKYKVLEKGDGLRLRSKADKEDGIVYENIDAGAYLDFISEKGDEWLKVSYHGKTGYVSRQYVEKCKVKQLKSNIADTLKKDEKFVVKQVTKSWCKLEQKDGEEVYVQRKYVDLKVKEDTSKKEDKKTEAVTEGAITTEDAVVTEGTVATDNTEDKKSGTKKDKKDKDSKIAGFMENSVAYEAEAIKDGLVKVVLPDGTKGFTKASTVQIEVLLDPPEVDTSVIPEEEEGIDTSNIKIKDIKVGANRKQIVNFALQFVGNPYVWGGTSLTKGADCSGFTQQIFKHAGISISRCSFEQVNDGKEIAFEDLRAGDLVFYWSKRAKRIGHVAMYIGDGKVVHASSKKTGIKVSKWNYRTPYKAVDIIGDDIEEKN